MKWRSRMMASGLAAVLVLPVAAHAGSGDFLLSRRFHGAIALGVSAWSFKAAYNARQDANRVYDRYKVAGTAQAARETYDESKRHDTKAALFLGVGIGTLAYSVHAFLSGDEALPPPRMQEGLGAIRGVRMDFTADPHRGGVTLELRKGF